MRCFNCEKEITTAEVLMFNRDCSDRWESVPLEENKDDFENPDHAVAMDVSTNWTGYDLTEKEQMEAIRCPHCGKFPFGYKGVQTAEILRIICFDEILDTNQGRK